MKHFVFLKKKKLINTHTECTWSCPVPVVPTMKAQNLKVSYQKFCSKRVWVSPEFLQLLTLMENEQHRLPKPILTSVQDASRWAQVKLKKVRCFQKSVMGLAETKSLRERRKLHDQSHIVSHLALKFRFLVSFPTGATSPAWTGKQAVLKLSRSFVLFVKFLGASCTTVNGFSIQKFQNSRPIPLTGDTMALKMVMLVQVTLTNSNVPVCEPAVVNER